MFSGKTLFPAVTPTNVNIREIFNMNPTEFSLCALPEGGGARVKELLSTGAMRRRLQDIGLTSGASVRCLLKSPSGGPAAYLIRGAVIALRVKDSADILVEA